VFRTVLDPGEQLSDERVKLTAGPIWGCSFHLIWTTKGPDAVREMPGGQTWLDVIEKTPERERYLAIHQGHLLEMNQADEAAWDAGGYVSLPELTMTGTTDEVAKAIRDLVDAGATEMMLEPSGPDIAHELEAHELERFITAARTA
jgi:hypothetical protein